MLECWNIGKMGFGILSCWVNGNNRFGDKIKMDNILLKTTIPSFHYSIIPWLGPKPRPQKISYIFIS